mmetsp:Transcript_9418/g.10858  ORF Transcript_9418/g.10858 Transcript_9418/m.10858 type:complete len:90 (+) Transcript_9418:652-921(+)
MVLFVLWLKGKRNTVILKKNSLVLKIQLMNVDQSRQVWELVDIDKYGVIDFQEFVITMVLVHAVEQGKNVPSEVPKIYIPPSKRALFFL